jgi:phage terminase large subunit
VSRRPPPSGNGNRAPLPPELWERLRDPLAFGKFFWPHVTFYKKQRDIIEAVEESDEVYVHANHESGKDFVTAFIALRFFLRWGWDPVRVVTTSVKDDHLRVLWGEIGRFVDTSAHPLLAKDGGPLVVNHREIRKVVGGKLDKISYLIGQVSEKGEGMAGHHAKHTMLIVDEASGVDDVVYERGSTWARKILAIGNPYGNSGFFYKGCKAGDLLAPEE